MTEETVNPLILTLALKPDEEAWFTTLRDKHFPAESNYLKAHLALFHQLPANDPAIIGDIKDITQELSPVTMQVTNVVSIGKGVAYKIESEALSTLHKKLQLKWNDHLIPQDKQKLWPHITVQNKVTPEVAKALINELLIGFVPFEIQGVGLSLWEYFGGPWQFKETYLFDKEKFKSPAYRRWF